MSKTVWFLITGGMLAMLDPSIATAGFLDKINEATKKLQEKTQQILDAKLAASGNISAQERKEWEEDIAAWRTAEQAGADSPTPPDPDNPYRWYDYVTNKERQEINMEHAQFNNKIMKECGDRPAGL